MTGLFTLTIGGLLTSCTHDEEYSTLVESKLQAYEKVFKQEFGEISPDQDWGFGTSSIQARTRAYMTRAQKVNAGENYPQTSTGINANANEWADPAKEFGGWLVPDPLTEGQKLRVMKYFQANPNLDYKDPEWRHFFVQQVYKGGTSPNANFSSETITAADGTTYDSDNMNLMTVGKNNQHINNFNAGSYGVNGAGGDPSVNVLDNGQSVGGTSHADQIMLMVNIDDTSCFGYHETGSSTHHNNKAALVSAADIDAWAAKNGNPGEAVVDKWNRSFLGFDLAIQEGEQAYAKDNSGNVIYPTYSAAPTSPIYGWDGKNVIQIADYDSNWQVVYRDGYKNLGVGYLSTNQNFYVAADKKTLTGEYSNGELEQTVFNDENLKNVLVFKDVKVPGAQNGKAHVLNLKLINDLIADGYVPVNDKNLKEWVKVGKSDGYFSDWIVTLTKANRIGEEITPTIPIQGGDTEIGVTYTTTYWYELNWVDQGRILCEDLGQIRASDIDFNDVVFDAYIYDAMPKKRTITTETSTGSVIGEPLWEDDTEASSYRVAEIYLLAAGGTLPVSVAGRLVKDEFNTWTGQLINTCVEDGSTLGGSYSNPWMNYTQAPKIEKIDGNMTMTLKDIPIVVKYGEQILELNADPGVAPHKICVPLSLEEGIDVRWPMERVVIKDAYTGFKKYVKNEDETITYTTDGTEVEQPKAEKEENGNGVPYFNNGKDDRYKACWNTPEEGMVFTETVSYTPRNLATNKYIEQGRDETKTYGTITVTGNGYKSGDPVLVRRRN